jgi:hypothetical protein
LTPTALLLSPPFLQFKGVWASINRRNEETHREDEQLKGLDLCLGHRMAALSITSTGTT